MSESWQIIEALLFASPEVVTSRKLANAADLTPSEVEVCIDKLNHDYTEQGRSFFIRKLAGGWQMTTQPRFAPWIARLLIKKSRDRLSKAALETLAVIAHRQPINKPDIDQARGIDSSYIIATLLERGLIKIRGRDKRAGHPYVYVTTDKFLEFFGIDSIKDLPDLEEPSVAEADILPVEDEESEEDSQTNGEEDVVEGDEAEEENADEIDPQALSAIGYRIEGQEKEPEEEEPEGKEDEASRS